MIRYTKGNIFHSNSEAVVNPVNTIGVMGKGLARQFRDRYPEMYEDYRKTCREKNLWIGHLHVYDKVRPTIINLPTKIHWIDQSQYEYVELGLVALRYELKYREISSCAIPALGCGNGGLDWNKVKDIIDSVMSNSDADITVYEPE